MLTQAVVCQFALLIALQNASEQVWICIADGQRWNATAHLSYAVIRVMADYAAQ